MKHINKFQTVAAYDAAEKYYPNVSYIEGTDEVVYVETPFIDYSTQYLTFEALGSGTFTLTIPSQINSTYMTSVSYSIDNGATWVDTTIDSTNQTITTPTIAQGDTVLWKGVGKQMAVNQSYTMHNSRFSSAPIFNVSGNIMSLLYGDNFQNQTSFPSGSSRNFCGLFAQITVRNAENLVLPATTLTSYCYYQMFFSAGLTTAPELPATTLAEHCYDNMFNACNFTVAPELPATTLATGCYQGMFMGCKYIPTAPELPATTLTSYCYYQMFVNCFVLNYITMLATDISASKCLSDWVSGVNGRVTQGTFVKAASQTGLPSGISGIPEGWTVVDA